MNITLDLKPEVTEEAAAQAAARGVSLEAYLSSMLARLVAPISSARKNDEACRHTGAGSHEKAQDPELPARVRSVRGKYAHLGVSTEDLHQERRGDRAREGG
jgi:hypothetical protein